MSSLDDATIRARSPAKTDHAISSSTNIIRKQHEKGRLTTTLQQSREIKALTNHLARKFDKVFSRSSELLSFQRSLVLRSSNKPLFVPFHPDDMILPSQNFHKSHRQDAVTSLGSRCLSTPHAHVIRRERIAGNPW